MRVSSSPSFRLRAAVSSPPCAAEGKQKAPEVLKPPGLIAGVGVRHALFPIGTRLGALAFAGGVLPDATLRGMRMFRSHGGTVPTVAGRNLRVRPLRPVRILPAGRFAPDVVLTRLQTSCSRVTTVATGTAPVFDRPFAPRYGSGLLPLRLPFAFAAG